MLSKNKRINTVLFKEILNLGKNYYFDYFSVKVLKKEGQELSCFAFVSSKKYFKQAIKRNLLKRKGYSVISNIYEKILPSYNIVFFFKKDIKDLTFSKLEEEIYLSLKKIKVLKEN